MSFSFIQITDHHLGASERDHLRGYATSAALARVLDHIAQRDAHGADFIVSTGDLVKRGTDEEYGFARQFLGLIDGGAAPPGPLTMNWPGMPALPFYVIPGNHDTRAEFSRNLFPSASPAEAIHTAFDHGGIRFVSVDTGTNGRQGEFSPEGIAWLRHHLQDGQPAIILLHHHPVPTGLSFLDEGLSPQLDTFWQIVASGNVLGILFGHSHAMVEDEVGGIPALGLQATCFSFAEQDGVLYRIMPELRYRVVTVDAKEMRSQVHEVPW